ncbi:MAG: hypothetical protein HQK52_12800 [Oligoflexia bacterium]|nr:hypothetical protein [Oligoflexia bacterium]
MGNLILQQLAKELINAGHPIYKQDQYMNASSGGFGWDRTDSCAIRTAGDFYDTDGTVHTIKINLP